ncbi:MAG: hypothetical protein QF886_22940, partial [Planctomycetota bacterium]|nr:hypothetical protein [Planctomycetota bacterium]
MIRGADTRSVLSAILFLIALDPLSAGQITQGDGLTVETIDKWPTTNEAGYFPLRVKIRNTAEERKLVIKVLVSGWSRPGTIEKPIVIGQGESVSVTIPVPHVSGQSLNLQFFVSEGGKVIPFHKHSLYTSRGGQSHSSTLIISDEEEKLSDLRNSNRSMSVIHIFPEEMPDGWICYSQVGYIAVSAAALESMPPSRRNDLSKWVATGGTLMVYRAGVAYGHLALLLGKQHVMKAIEADEDLHPLEHYMGTIYTERGDPLLKSAIRGGYDFVFWRANRGKKSFQERFGFQGISGAAFPVPGLGRIPVVGYTLMMILFAIAIGPVNFFWLKLKRKSHLMFLTTPLAAAVVSLSMFLYGSLAEGFGIKSRQASVTYLDQDRHEMVNMGRMALYMRRPPW